MVMNGTHPDPDDADPAGTRSVRPVVIAPDEFGGTMSASQAAHAIADGWRSVRPNDVLDLLPQSDGGPGFLEVLADSLGGELRTVGVPGPLGDPVEAQLLVDGRTVYVESAQACGLHLLGTSPSPQSAQRANTAGVGVLLDRALAAGAARIVVGLGGSGSTDGGRGAVQALGGLAAARARFRDVELIAATDVTNPLLGPTGATAVFGPQRGADAPTVAALEARLTAWSRELELDAEPVATRPGAGAAGGLGALLLALGGRREAGAALVAAVTGRAARIAGARLVITGEGTYDAQTRYGKVVASVAADARAAHLPAVVIAGQVGTDAEVAGVSAVYSMTEWAGSVQRAMREPRAILAEVAAHVAATGDPAAG